MAKEKTKTSEKKVLPEGFDEKDPELLALLEEFDLDITDLLEDSSSLTEKKGEEEDEKEEDPEDEMEDEEDPEEDEMEEEGTKKKTIKAEDYKFDFTDDVLALIGEETEFTQTFKEKAAVIFEASINSKVNSIIVDLEKKYAERLAEERDEIQSALALEIDNYLNYVTKEWMNENRLVIENGLRTEISEDFIRGLKTLFQENYIEVPDSKVDLVDELANKVTKLEEQLNASISTNLETVKNLNSLKREKIVNECAKDDMTDTEVEKFTALIEGIEFVDEGDFKKKIGIIKESHFPAKKEPNKDTSMTRFEQDNDKKPLSENTSMDMYAKAIEKQMK